MKQPKSIYVIIRWVDEKGIHHQQSYRDKNIDAAITLLQLMNGDITEEDLKP